MYIQYLIILEQTLDLSLDNCVTGNFAGFNIALEKEIQMKYLMLQLQRNSSRHHQTLVKEWSK